MAWFAANFLVLHILLIRLLWEHNLVWDILNRTQHCLNSLFPKTFVQSCPIPYIPSFSQWLTYSGPALITLTTFFSPSLGCSSFFGQCFSNEPFDLSFRGLLFQSLLQETLCQVCALGADVCSSTELLWGTEHTDCPYGPSTPQPTWTQATLIHNRIS